MAYFSNAKIFISLSHAIDGACAICVLIINVGQQVAESWSYLYPLSKAASVPIFQSDSMQIQVIQNKL